MLLNEVFHRLITVAEDETHYWQTVEELIAMRSGYMIERLLEGLNMSFDEALDKLRQQDGFANPREKEVHEILVAAIDNLIDFATYQTATLLDNIPQVNEMEIAIQEYDKKFSTYFNQYAKTENSHILHAAMIAYWWLNTPEDAIITYKTQSDERVRPWHLSYEGVSYPKYAFPSELIPPIEWRCRCYLESEDGMALIKNETVINPEIQVNPVFNESLARGGKIFSYAHPYFTTTLSQPYVEIAIRLKSKFEAE